MKKKLLFLASIMALSFSVVATGCIGGETSNDSTASNNSTESSVPASSVDESSNDSVTESSTPDSSVEETTLAVPTITLNADKSVTWTAVDGATGYVVNVNGIDLDATTELAYAVQTAVDEYTIKVKAITANAESAYSENVSYSIYAVTLTAGNGYTLTGATSVVGGENYTFTLTGGEENYDYTNMVVKVNGTAVTAVDGVYTVENVSETLVITVEGVLAFNSYAVTFTEGDGYTLVGENSAIGGKNYTFTVETGVVGYDYTNMIVKVNGTAVTAVDGVYTIENVSEDLAISVEGIKVSEYTVTVPETQEGYTIVCDTTSIVHGDDFYFSVTLAKYYGQSPLVVKVNGVEVTPYEKGQYAVAEVMENLTITVEGIEHDGKYQYVRDIVGDPLNAGDGVVFDDETGVASATASSNGMSIFLDSTQILYYGEGYDYLKLRLSSSTAAEFVLVTTAEGGTEDWQSVYVTLSKATDYYIPLNDTSKHDFQYTIQLYVAGKDQNITIEEIGFTTQAEMDEIEAELAKVAPIVNIENWEATGDGSLEVATSTSNSVSIRGWGFQLKAAAVQELMAAGYNQLTLTVSPSGQATHVYVHGTIYTAGDTLTFELKKYENTGIRFYPKNAASSDASVDGMVTISNIEIAFVEVEHPDPEALAVVVDANNWVATDGGTVHIDEVSSLSIQVGGWFFKLAAEAVQELIDLGYGELSFTMTAKYSNGTTPTHFYFSQTKTWCTSGETITLKLADYVGSGIKIRPANGGASETYVSDGSMLIDNITFTKTADMPSDTPDDIPDAEAMAIVVNADNWDATDGGSIHVDATTATSIQVGGWFFKLAAEAVQELIDLGYSELSFTMTAKYANGTTPTHFYFSQTKTWCTSGETITLKLADYVGSGIKIRPANGGASETYVSDGSMLIDNITFKKGTIDDQAMAIVVNANNWEETDGGSVHVDSATATSITVGGWYFKLSKGAVQELIDLGYSQISFTMTIKGYGGATATDFYLNQTNTWYKSGDTVTLTLASYVGTGIKFRPATGGASEGYFSDGSILIDNIIFTKGTAEDAALAILLNSANWVATDGGTVHVDEIAADKIVVGGWYYKLTKEAVQELIALGYKEVSFTITSRGYSGNATHFYFAVSEGWYESGATVTLNLEAHKENGIKVRPATGAASSSNFSDGAMQIENIVFTK